MLNELVFTESKTLRKQFIDRTDLIPFPGDLFTLNQIGEYLKESADLLGRLIQEKHNEFKSETKLVLSDLDSSSFKAEKLYTKKAFLLLCMLLKKNDFSKNLRQTLLAQKGSFLDG